MAEPQPVDFFGAALHHRVRVKLNHGDVYCGTLALIDGLMNVVLENAALAGTPETYPECFIRGNNGTVPPALTPSVLHLPCGIIDYARVKTAMYRSTPLVLTCSRALRNPAAAIAASKSPSPPPLPK